MSFQVSGVKFCSYWGGSYRIAATGSQYDERYSTRSQTMKRSLLLPTGGAAMSGATALLGPDAGCLRRGPGAGGWRIELLWVGDARVFRLSHLPGISRFRAAVGCGPSSLAGDVVGRSGQVTQGRG